MARLKRLAWLRNDAESNNSALEDKLFNNKAHSVDHLSQTATLLGDALLINSLTLYLAKRRGGVRWPRSLPTRSPLQSSRRSPAT